MSESGKIFQVRQTLNINGKTRTIEFTIDRGGAEDDEEKQSIVLQITEVNKRVLSIRVEREMVKDPSNGTSYKFTIDMDRNDRETRTKLTAEIEGKDVDFSWFDIPESNLVIKLNQKSVEGLVAEFTKDLVEFLSCHIKVREE
ncbi:MAG: hypothetical protein JHC26_11900 [Thermofilum sp.]|jgi:hypothetical protein|uniref:hypothetical protein n=1 Tax=Thermofilum sp. TaxID=1961369 RepID=UPI00258289A6|nr:hypothetical protein [Thermofilum sp.]MCI4409787.1 hypothetical protein [Thermofilum sp.]